MNNFNKKNIWFVSLFFTCFALNAKIGESIDLQIQDYIVNQWTQFKMNGSLQNIAELKNELIIQVKPVWEQSNVKDCDEELMIKSVQQQFIGNLSLKIQCESKNWGMYVPVYVGKLEKVIALSNNVERGQKLTNGVLEIQVQDVGQLNQGYYTDKKQLSNMEASRHLSAGQLLTPLMLNEMDLINKGDHVMIVIQKGELRVQMPGIALASGKKGKQISVRNRSSSRIIKAVIKEKGLVEIVI
ncbi:flagellar basal body P-ring formation chaperone FlgA [Marinicellulosiphila megalodicopiae]|uniref:flagellar basal body P-ring formation chaperone FlgA n=1 Tax=Marinicellulosiphila megalodicopiae TaxID=2724896 RepID=UPI003BAEE843